MEQEQQYTFITWNLEFIINNWNKRKQEIIKVLNQYNEVDFCALQEVGIPGTLEKSILSQYAKYTSKKIIFDPVMKRTLLKFYIFRILLDILFNINCVVFNLLGSVAYTLYEIKILRIFYLLFGTPLFFGLASIVSNKYIILEKERFSLGNYRITQAFHLKIYNRNLDFWTINLHLSPDNKKNDAENKQNREKEVNQLLKFINSKIGNKDCFILGDWNCNPDDIIFKKLKDNSFVNCVQHIIGTNVDTFPTYKKSPKAIGNSDRYEKQCVDYIWYRGTNFSVKSFRRIGTEECSDHFGLCIKVSLTN